MRLAVEIAEDQWLTILGWQAVNFFVEDGFQVFLFTVLKVVLVVHDGTLLLVVSPPGIASPSFHSHPTGDPVKPGGHRLARMQRTCFVGQYQERRLESVLHVLLVSEDLPAHLQHQRPVPAEQGGKGIFLMLLDESLQQSGVAVGLSWADLLP